MTPMDAGNSAVDNGGGLMVTASALTARGGAALDFSGNRATNGAAAVVDGGNFSLAGASLVVRSNAGDYGGGFYLINTARLDLRGQAAFAGNAAAQLGGGLYATWTSLVAVPAGGAAEFRNNTCNSGSGGGGYLARGSSMSVHGGAVFAGAPSALLGQ
jgi:hypothetical protein